MSHPIVTSTLVVISQADLQLLTDEKKTLIEENQRLKSEIMMLKGNNDRLQQENDHQRTVITELREENERLKKEIQELNRRIDRLEDDKLLDKLVYGLQSLNSSDKLENEFKYLRKLRRDRNNDAHYILDNDSEQVRKYKKRLLYNHLKIAENNTYLSAKLKKKYSPKIFDDILKYLLNVKLDELSEEDRDDADSFWE